MPLVISKQENSYIFSNVDNTNLIDHIPKGIYGVGITEDGNPVLSKILDKFTLPDKVYGSVAKRSETMVSAFNQSKTSVGALLFGEKGTGKTLQAEHLSNAFLDLDIPVIKIDGTLPVKMLRFLASAISPCVFFFDEYEKGHDEDVQQAMLSLFSDMSLRKVFFILTGNDNSKLDSNFNNRPTRFKFNINYSGLEPEVALDLIKEKVKDEAKADRVKRYYNGNVDGDMSFDIMVEYIDLVTKHDDMESLHNELSILNIPPEPFTLYKVIQVTHKGVPILLRDMEVVREKERYLLLVNTHKEESDVTELVLNEWCLEDVVSAQCDNRLNSSPPAGQGTFVIEIGDFLVTMDVELKDVYHSLNSSRVSTYEIDGQSVKREMKANPPSYEEVCEIRGPDNTLSEEEWDELSPSAKLLALKLPNASHAALSRSGRGFNVVNDHGMPLIFQDT